MSLDYVPLEKVADVTKLAGFEFSKYFNYLDEGEIIALRGVNLKNGALDLNDVKYIDKKTSEKLPRSKLYKNDIVLTYTGTIGSCAFINEDNKFHSAPNIAKITPKDNINPKYLFYVINSPFFRKQMENFKVGSTQPTIPMKTIRILKIPLLSSITQNSIVKILDNIENKITTNQKINHNLDKLLSTIFVQWFINYEKYDKTKGMIFNENFGEIPINYSEEMLEDFVDFVTGVEPGSKNYQENFSEGFIPFIRVGDLGSRDNMVYIEEDLSKNKILEFDDIVLSLDATVGIVKMGLEGAYSTGIRKLVIKDNRINKPFLYCLVKSSRIQRIIETFATGTTILHAGKSIKHMNFILSDEETMNDFNSLGQPILSKILANLKEINRLTNLRDTLLPKLMSGEIDVSEINCDLKLYFIKLILKLTTQIRRYFNMKTKIISKIQNQMKPFLNQGQYLKLTNSLLNSFKDVEILDNNNESNETDNVKLLNSFLSAKQVEGRSEKTIVYYKSTLEKMLKAIPKQVYNITTDDIRKYLFKYKEEKDSSKITLDNMRRIFSSFFSWLEDEDYILKNPVRRIHRVKTGRVVKEVLTDENLEILRDNCKEIRDLSIVEILISTGIRVGELVRLNIKDVNFYERECVVFGKGESERVVYFDARTKIHLLEYLESREDDNPALFVSLKKPYQRLGISGVETRLRELGRKCNIPKVHPHKFRRTLATNAIDKGMPIEQVQKLLGHVQIDTTMQYAMVNQSNVKIAHRKFIS